MRETFTIFPIITLDMGLTSTIPEPRTTTMCPHCNRPFKTDAGLAAHVSTKHKPSVKQDNPK